MIAPRRREIGLGAFLQRMNITKSSGRNLFFEASGTLTRPQPLPPDILREKRAVDLRPIAPGRPVFSP